MQYKTITLALIQERPDLYERLHSSRRLLRAMDIYATGLKASHDTAKQAIAVRRPGSDPSQVAAEALELAIQDLRDRLLSASPKDEAELMIDEAMEFLRLHTPPA